MSMHRKFGNPQMQTTLWITYLPKLIATILKAFREQFEENHWLNAVKEKLQAHCQKSLLSMIRSWKKEENPGTSSTVGMCPKILCWVRDAKKLIGYILKVSTRLSQCKSAEMWTSNRWTWFGWIQTSLWIRHARKFDRGCVQESTERRSKVRFNELYQLLNCSLQCNVSKWWRCLSQPWCRWVCRTKKGIEVDTQRHQQSISKASAQRLIYVNRLAKDRQKYGEDKLVKSICGTQDASCIWQLDYVN